MQHFILCLTLLLVGCSRTTTRGRLAQDIDLAALNKIITQEIGESHEIDFNTSKTYLLAYREKEITETFTTYLVLNVSTRAIIKRGSFRPGYIKWKDASSIELLDAPGIIPDTKSLNDYKQTIIIEKIN
jgi:hypothetical protein